MSTLAGDQFLIARTTVIIISRNYLQRTNDASNTEGSVSKSSWRGGKESFENQMYENVAMKADSDAERENLTDSQDPDSKCNSDMEASDVSSDEAATSGLYT